MFLSHLYPLRISGESVIETVIRQISVLTALLVAAIFAVYIATFFGDTAVFILEHNRVISTVCKHIARNSISFIGRGVGICVDETMVCRIVVTALEVIPSRFGVVIVPTTL